MQHVIIRLCLFVSSGMLVQLLPVGLQSTLTSESLENSTESTTVTHVTSPATFLDGIKSSELTASTSLTTLNLMSSTIAEMVPTSQLAALVKSDEQLNTTDDAITHEQTLTTDEQTITALSEASVAQTNITAAAVTSQNLSTTSVEKTTEQTLLHEFSSTTEQSVKNVAAETITTLTDAPTGQASTNNMTSFESQFAQAITSEFHTTASEVTPTGQTQPFDFTSTTAQSVTNEDNSTSTVPSNMTSTYVPTLQTTTSEDTHISQTTELFYSTTTDLMSEENATLTLTAPITSTTPTSTIDTHTVTTTNIMTRAQTPTFTRSTKDQFVTTTAIPTTASPATATLTSTNTTQTKSVHEATQSNKFSPRYISSTIYPYISINNDYVHMCYCSNFLLTVNHAFVTSSPRLAVVTLQSRDKSRLGYYSRAV